MSEYVHGYDEAAKLRLGDQANALEGILHDGTRYAEGEHVLEIGCGVGSQTAILLRNNPKTRFTAIDLSPVSIDSARRRLSDNGERLRLEEGDVRSLGYADATFDHVFVCFVLEHLPSPEAALAEIKRVLKPGGILTVIEGDHGSVIMYPKSSAALDAIGAQCALQANKGGDALIGRRLYPLMKKANFDDVTIMPRQVYADGSTPQLADAFTRKTFTAMIEGIRGEALEKEIIEADLFDEGIAALEVAAGAHGTFAYTFFKATGFATI